MTHEPQESPNLPAPEKASREDSLLSLARKSIELAEALKFEGRVLVSVFEKGDAEQDFRIHAAEALPKLAKAYLKLRKRLKEIAEHPSAEMTADSQYRMGFKDGCQDCAKIARAALGAKA